jgi:predicted HTH transcriptional regulator
LIEEGESNRVEFKSSIRFNLHIQKNDKKIEHAILKSIAAFLNPKGGVFLIGVNDKGEILGLENDDFKNDDKMLLHVTNLIKDNIDSSHLRYITLIPEEYEGKKILRCDVDPSTIPAYVKNGREEYFYIRTGPSTSALPVSEIYDFVRHRFYTVRG